MQRIIDGADQVVEDMLTGYLAANADTINATANPRVLRRAGGLKPGKVGLVTGGGSGHEPAFLGYVGEGLLDAVAIGEVFTSPSAQAFLDAFRAADAGAGVACLFGNYAGDTMNVKLATRQATAAGIRVRSVVANDDVASAPPSEREKRRGVAGEILMWKIAGAKAAAGASLDEVVATAQRAIDATRSVGIGLTPCTIPAVGRPNFEIEPGTMEVGIGHHGEPGVAVEPLTAARDIARRMIEVVVPDLPFGRGDEVVVLLSGLGATPVMELYILYGHLAAMLEAAGIRIHRSYVGNYFTSLEMMGVTLTVMKLDEELRALVDADADSVGFCQHGR